MTTVRTYDRNRLTVSYRTGQAVRMRLWLEGEAMDWRSTYPGSRDSESIAQRRDMLGLQRRARLDPNATPLRVLPG